MFFDDSVNFNSNIYILVHLKNCNLKCFSTLNTIYFNSSSLTQIVNIISLELSSPKRIFKITETNFPSIFNRIIYNF